MKNKLHILLLATALLVLTGCVDDRPVASDALGDAERKNTAEQLAAVTHAPLNTGLPLSMVAESKWDNCGYPEDRPMSGWNPPREYRCTASSEVLLTMDQTTDIATAITLADDAMVQSGCVEAGTLARDAEALALSHRLEAGAEFIGADFTCAGIPVSAWVVHSASSQLADLVTYSDLLHGRHDEFNSPSIDSEMVAALESSPNPYVMVLRTIEEYVSVSTCGDHLCE
jgi:hypothetical protein